MTFVILFASMTSPLHAQEAPTNTPSPLEQLEIAENEFRYQDYAKAESLIRPLLYPTVRLGTRSTRIKAREYLATCLWWLKNKDEARKEFTALLLEAPTHRLDPFYYPADLVSFLESLRQELRTKGVLTPIKVPIKPDIKQVKVERAQAPWTTNFIPLGVPQFMQNRNKTAWTLLIGQTLSIGTNIVAALWIEQLRGPDGFFSSADFSTAQNLNRVWWVSTALIAGLYSFGVVDGFLSAPEQTVPTSDTR